MSKIVLTIEATNAELMCRNVAKISYRSSCRAVRDVARVFRKRPGPVLIGTCALMRMNMVINLMMIVPELIVLHNSHNNVYYH